MAYTQGQWFILTVILFSASVHLQFVFEGRLASLGISMWDKKQVSIEKDPKIIN